MNVPNSVINSVTKSPTDNNLFYGAEQMWQRLTAIKKNDMQYLDIDMSLLVNCLECYYKGLLTASDVNTPDYIIKQGHNLLRLTEEIETKTGHYLQYNRSSSDLRDRRIFLTDLSKNYIGCRYNHVQIDKSIFLQCYAWLEKQRHLVLDIVKTYETNNIFIDEIDSLDIDEFDR